MKNFLIATMTGAVILSTGAALANSSAGHNQFDLNGFKNTKVNTATEVSSTFDGGNRGFNAIGHNEFDNLGFKNTKVDDANSAFGNRARNTVAQEFSPWVGSR